MSYVVELVFFTEEPIRRVLRGRCIEKTENFLRYRDALRRSLPAVRRGECHVAIRRIGGES